MKPKLLFIDRDGTLIKEPEDNYQVDSLEKLEFMPHVFTQLQAISAQLDYLLVMVTNQDGLGTEAFPEAKFWPAHEKMLQTFAKEDILFHAVHIDRTFKHEKAPTRKPGTAMLTQYLEGNYDLANSYVIGDRHSDMLLAKNLGAKGILYGESTDQQDQIEDLSILTQTIVLNTQSWKEIRDFLFYQQPRRCTISRKTLETDVQVKIDLDGMGKTLNQTGIGFLDHMLDQVGRHGDLNLEVQVLGDLHIDEHHTIEDTAITIGQAFSQALGSKTGIARYGSAAIPMDEALAQVALDFSGRAFLHFDADIPRERVGNFPVEMIEHFFQSFVQHAACTLHISAYGKNAHHIIEAIFKAFARSLAMAKYRDPDDDRIPSTKRLL